MDYVIVKWAMDKNGLVLSNDKFDHLKQKEELEEFYEEKVFKY